MTSITTIYRGLVAGHVGTTPSSHAGCTTARTARSRYPTTYISPGGWSRWASRPGLPRRLITMIPILPLPVRIDRLPGDDVRNRALARPVACAPIPTSVGPRPWPARFPNRALRSPGNPPSRPAPPPPYDHPQFMFHVTAPLVWCIRMMSNTTIILVLMGTLLN